MSPLPNYTNIKVRGKWNRQQIRKSGFLGKKLDENMVTDISWAYYNYFGQQAAVAYYDIKFYQHLSFTIIDDDNTVIKEDIKLQVGDVVEMEGQDDNEVDVDVNNEKWFARIQAILIHQSNDDNYHVFLLFEWFDQIGFDQLMQCNKYLVQGDRDNWKRIHPISIVNSHRKVHFVHDCGTSCTIEKHDINNRHYFKNDFLFTAV